MPCINTFIDVLQKFCDEPGMELIGKLYIKLPDEYSVDRPVEFTLMFGELLINATARCKKSGTLCKATFEYTKPGAYGLLQFSLTLIVIEV
ncbi:8507_t:CDS:2 [Entrophospora sp. SA101]|nr:8507_t:CDS:2 [Entrophospora sp. SA101]